MFNEMNVNAQCVSCNLFRHGNLHEYAARLLEKFGKEKFDALIVLGRTLHQLTEDELLGIINKYNDYEGSIETNQKFYMEEKVTTR